MQWPALALLLAAGAHGAEGADGAEGSGSGACVDHGFAYNSTLACQLRKVARGSNVINTTGGRFCDGAFGKKYCCATCSAPDESESEPPRGCRVPRRNAPCLQWDCPLGSVQPVGTACRVRARNDARCRRSCGAAGVVSAASGEPWADAARTCTELGGWSLDRPVCAIHAHHWGHPKLPEPERAEEGSAPEAQKKKVCKAKFPNQPPDMTIHPFSAVASSYDWNHWGEKPLHLHNGSHFFDKYSPVFGINMLGFITCKGKAKLNGFLHATGLMAGLTDWDMDGKPNCPK